MALTRFRSRALMIALAAVLVVGGCETASKPNPVAASAPAPVPQPAMPPDPVAMVPDPVPEHEFHWGREGSGFAASRDIEKTVTPSRRIPVGLSFVDADVAAVADAVLGETLKHDYMMDPAVGGKITFHVQGALTPEQLIAAFEAALGLNDLALSVRDGRYLIQPVAKARTSVRFSGAKSPGFGATAVVLSYASVAEITKVLGAFAPSGSVAYADEKKGLIVLAGSEADRAAALETIALFDVDAYREASFGIFRLKHATADTLAAELKKVTAAVGVELGEVVPLGRMNALIVISKRRAALEEASSWIDRLDAPAAPGGLRLHVYRPKNTSAATLAEAVSKILTGTQQGADGKTSAASVSADSRSNAVIVQADKDTYAEVEGLLRTLDVLPDQIMVEATIVEVTLNDELRYGVQWLFGPNDGSTFTLSNASNGSAASSFPGFSYSFITGSTEAVLNALAAKTDVEVISSPKIITLDHQTASLQVGDQVPIIRQSVVSTDTSSAPIVNSTEYRDTGVILKVTPHINGEGSVIIEVVQEVSEVARTTTSGIDSPTIQQRKLASTLVVSDGAMVALGGLISSNRSRNDSGVPFLKDAPLVGNLFKSNSNATRRTEMIVFLRPTIIRGPDQFKRATDDLREAMGELRTRGLIEGTQP